MIKLMLITNNPELARYAVGCGVDRIFVDLELIGKKERQGHLDTLISYHTMADVPIVRAAIPDAELLVRLNPIHDHTEAEVEAALAAGADLLMLPMYRHAHEVARFCAAVGGRAGVVPLLETAEAINALPEVVQIPGVTEIYIGLNDLHLALKFDFMFEPLATGLVDQLAQVVKDAGLPFGFGGIARMGEGLLPGEAILGEHVRLGSSSVILSRTFHRRSESLDELHSYMDFGAEIGKVRDVEAELTRRSAADVERNRQSVREKVSMIVGIKTGTVAAENASAMAPEPRAQT